MRVVCRDSDRAAVSGGGCLRAQSASSQSVAASCVFNRARLSIVVGLLANIEHRSSPIKNTGDC